MIFPIHIFPPWFELLNRCCWIARYLQKRILLYTFSFAIAQKEKSGSKQNFAKLKTILKLQKDFI